MLNWHVYQFYQAEVRDKSRNRMYWSSVNFLFI